jgi:hypothetical protein
MTNDPRQQRVDRLLNDARYHFAKTLAANPHWYCLRREFPSSRDFTEVCRFIMETGHDEVFWGKIYRYYIVDGWKYWTMGWPPEETTLINRKPVAPAYLTEEQMATVLSYGGGFRDDYFEITPAGDSPAPRSGPPER